VLYAFGSAWKPESSTPDKYFEFCLGRGVHDIHMNQGSIGRFQDSNGVWQDEALNVLPDEVNLNNWILANKQKHHYRLSDIRLKAGNVVTISLVEADIQLPNEGGIITLLNAQGIKVHGVSYTKENAQKQGSTVVF
jgi:hypothetical protein